jgi:ribonuclease R
LRGAASTPAAGLASELVLRCQAQAAYSPTNIGHFGLALRRYTHFTSPIRRYADLIVHRALISAMEPGTYTPKTGTVQSATAADELAAISEHISETERRAVAAERAATGRYRATLLASSIGSVFAGHINGVAEFGLFVTLHQSGADGLVPVSSLPADFYEYDKHRQRLIGRRSGRVFGIGNGVSVRLVDADGIGGRILLHLDEDGTQVRERSRPRPFVSSRSGRRRR